MFYSSTSQMGAILDSTSVAPWLRLFLPYLRLRVFICSIRVCNIIPLAITNPTPMTYTSNDPAAPASGSCTGSEDGLLVITYCPSCISRSGLTRISPIADTVTVYTVPLLSYPSGATISDRYSVSPKGYHRSNIARCHSQWTAEQGNLPKDLDYYTARIQRLPAAYVILRPP